MQCFSSDILPHNLYEILLITYLLAEAGLVELVYNEVPHWSLLESLAQ